MVFRFNEEKLTENKEIGTDCIQIWEGMIVWQKIYMGVKYTNIIIFLSW